MHPSSVNHRRFAEAAESGRQVQRACVRSLVTRTLSPTLRVVFCSVVALAVDPSPTPVLFAHSLLLLVRKEILHSLTFSLNH